MPTRCSDADRAPARERHAARGHRPAHPLPHASRRGPGRRRGVSFSLDRGRTLGIVGESGSGKTVLSRSIMGLLGGKSLDPRPGPSGSRARSSIGRPAKQMRHIWGQEMAMIFQDPMTSLNPLMKIGEQITEPLQVPPRDELARRRGRPPSACSRDVRIPEAGASARPVPARAVRRHAPAGDDRHRAGVRPDAALRRRADHRPRRHRAGADPRPDRRAAPGAQHVGDPRHPRPRRRRRPHRRDRRDVRRPDRREGTDEDAVRQHEDAVHRGADGRASRSSRTRRTPGSARSPADRPTSSTRPTGAGSRPAARTPGTAATPRSRRWSPADDRRTTSTPAGTRSARRSTTERASRARGQRAGRRVGVEDVS